MAETFAVVDEYGDAIGSATRTHCHGGSFLLHAVIHLLVFNSAGDILLQKRAMTKDIQPGRWDTSVGGHQADGESACDALVRETVEELGIHDVAAGQLYTYIMESPVEREHVTTFRCVWDGPVTFQREEIDEVAWFSPGRIETMIGTGLLTPNFEEEWGYYHRWRAANGE